MVLGLIIFYGDHIETQSTQVCITIAGIPFLLAAAPKPQDQDHADKEDFNVVLMSGVRGMVRGPFTCIPASDDMMSIEFSQV